MLAEKCIAGTSGRSLAASAFSACPFQKEFGGAGADDFRFNGVVGEEIAASASAWRHASYPPSS